MLVIGLTGGIGTGKSEVAAILDSLGALVINADQVGHETYRSKTKAWQEIVEAFGEGVLSLDGEVDRKKLGAIVFGDSKSLTRLNAIMHPQIHAVIEGRIKGLERKGQGLVVVEAALLLEAGWTTLVDEVWVIASSEECIIRRLRSRNGMDEQAIQSRIDSQMSQRQRLRGADVVIDNDGDLEDLRLRVTQLWASRLQAHQETENSR